MFKIKLIKRGNTGRTSVLPIGNLEGRKFVFDGDTYLIKEEHTNGVILLLLMNPVSKPFKYYKSSLETLFRMSKPAYWIE